MPHRKTQPKQDIHTAIVAGVSAATGEPIPRGEDLLGSPELKRKFKAAKASLRSPKPPRK